MSLTAAMAVAALLASVLLGCQSHGEPHIRFRSNSLQHAASIFTVYFTKEDIQAARDVALELEAQLPRLRKDLQYEYRHSVAIEIYPDQGTYDACLMDPSVRGSPACSGRRTIQMVSPRSPIRVAGIPYRDRLAMAVHELAHLFLNEINGSLPVWLQEGVASFEGGADGYRRICKIPEIAGLLRNLPSLADLERFNRVVAGDVIAFTFVDFVVTEHGPVALNRLIRNPGSFQNALGYPSEAVESHWRQFVRTRYK